jgi:hypothetical protein
MAEVQELNLTPSPRVLRMLGQIDFKPWQCLAELIDNSVDAFLTAREQPSSDAPSAAFPQVNVELSGASEIRRGTGELRVTDNGPGMSQEILEDAVRAGYSSNDSADKLGLFGMGFNVATARLGGRTEVWTTRKQDDHWFGVRIDFDEMEKAQSFRVPGLRRRKIAGDELAHGTEVMVTKLGRERALYLRSGGGLKSTRDKLTRVYNKIMREIGLKVVLVGTPLTSRDFCVWGRNRFVDTKGDFGRVPAYLVVDENLGSGLYCNDCWVWLLDTETVCPVCGKSNQLRRRERRVNGWLGIQRYFDQTDYGIDLVRNGRVIEERSKVFFSWTNPETDDSVPEYPLEQTHWGGRIVGELNVDFVPLASHQKDAFDKTSKEWHMAEEVVRGRGPIIQKYRQQAGYLDRNASTLARLHSAFRRGQPAGLRNLVPGDSNGKGFNRPAVLWAGLFAEGNPDYQTDEKWYEAVLIAEEANSKKRGASVPEAMAGVDAFPEDTEGEPEQHADIEPMGEIVQLPQRQEDPSLSGTFELPEVPGAPRLEVSAEQVVTGRLDGGKAIQFATIAGRAEFIYDPRHLTFTQSLLQPVDCLIEELAYQLLARSSATQSEFPLSELTAKLRYKYFPWTVNTYDSIKREATSLLDEMIEYFTEALSPLTPLSVDSVSTSDRTTIAEAVARLDHGGEDRVKEVIQSGEYPKYLGPRSLPHLIRKWPELALDGHFFVLSYADVDRRLREDVLQQVVTPLQDLIWISNPDGPQAGGPEWRNMLGRTASSLRLLVGWKSP